VIGLAAMLREGYLWRGMPRVMRDAQVAAMTDDEGT
jgi:hypothetical protein